MKLASKQELDHLIAIYRSNDLAAATLLAKRLANQYPDDCVIFNVLAVICIRNGDLSAARASGEHAVSLNFSYRDAVFNLADIYLRQKEFERARVLISRWVRQNNEDTQSLGVLLEAANGLSEKHTALKYCERLHDYGVASERLTILKSQLLQSLGRLEDALAWIQAGDKQYTHSHWLRITEANILSDLGRIEEAHRLYESIKCDEPEQEKAHLLDFANFCIELGEFDRAESKLETVLTRNPYEAQAWVGLSKLPMNKSTLERLEVRLCNALNNTDLPENDKAHLYFAHGHCAHKLNKYDSAFRSFAEGNRLRSQQTPFNFESEKALFKNVRDVFEILDTQRWPSNGIDITPVFVVGLPRSGTTLIEQILGAHSDVSALGEVELLKAEFYQWLISVKEQALDTHALREITKNYLELMSLRASGASHFVDKLPLNFVWLGFIARLMPHARFIHISKSPLAACWSLYKQEFKGYTCSYDFKSLSQYYGLYVEHMEYWRSKVHGSQLLEITYEGLVDEPLEHIGKILALCNLSQDPKVLNFSGSNQSVRTLSATQLRSGITSKFKSEVDVYRSFLQPLIENLKNEGIDV